MVSEDHIEYLASGSGEKPSDHERLDMIRSILGDEATWSEPPPEVGEAILAAIGEEAGPVPRRSPERTRNRLRPVFVAAAAAALVAVLFGLSALFTTHPGELVIAIEGTELRSDASGLATLRPTESGWWVRLEVAGLGAAPPGSYYEGWVWSDDGEGVSIGTFHLRGDSEPVILWSGVDPAEYPWIWVTLEDEDGDPSASERVVMRGRIQASQP